MADELQTGNIKNVEIFSVGTWRGSKSVSATPAMLDQIVANFNTINKVSGYGVPLKLGHNSRVGEPAYGWMSDLQRVDNVLVADFSDVPAEIVDAAKKRRYNSVSVELYPMIAHAGDTFENVLGGVALLGAEWPAVKGLKPLSASVFAEAGEKIELSKEIDTVNTFTEDQHAALLSAAVTKAVTDTKAESAAALSAATAATAAEKTRADKAEADLAVFAETAEKSEIAAIITAAEGKGQIVPANKASVEAFAESIRANTAKGDARKSLIATFKSFVEAMPPKVNFGEKGAAKVEDTAVQGDKIADQVNAKVQAHMAANTGSTYEKSLNAVFAADPELKTAYAQEM